MQTTTHPTEDAARLKDLERRVSQLLVDVDRLWRHTANTSEGEVIGGIPTTATTTATTTGSSSSSSTTDDGTTTTTGSSSSSTTSDCVGQCDYDATAYGPSPTGYIWQLAADTCVGESCAGCPPVDSAFLLAHGYPAGPSSTLTLGCDGNPTTTTGSSSTTAPPTTTTPSSSSSSTTAPPTTTTPSSSSSTTAPPTTTTPSSSSSSTTGACSGYCYWESPAYTWILNAGLSTCNCLCVTPPPFAATPGAAYSSTELCTES